MQLCVSETSWNWNSLAGRTALLNTASHSGWDPYCCTTLLGFGAALDLLLTDDLRALPLGGCGYVCSLPPLTQRLVWVNSGFCKPFGLHEKHDLNPSHYNFWFLRQREVKKQKVTSLWFFCFLLLKIILQTAQVVNILTTLLMTVSCENCFWRGWKPKDHQTQQFPSGSNRDHELIIMMTLNVNQHVEKESWGVPWKCPCIYDTVSWILKQY